MGRERIPLNACKWKRTWSRKSADGVEFRQVRSSSRSATGARVSGLSPGTVERGSPGMSVREEIDRYIADQSPAKRAELAYLHRRILEISPDAKLWFLDGKNDEGKVVSNPNIGYGSAPIRYANGESRAFYKVGLSANTSGISLYVMGLKDKRYLSETYGSRVGKA